MSIKHYINESTASNSYVAMWKSYLMWDVGKFKMFDLMWLEDVGSQASEVI